LLTILNKSRGKNRPRSHSFYRFLTTEKSIAVQLRGPSSLNGTGRVEVYHNGQWGTICDDGWDIRDARVVCRELGYKDAVRALQGRFVPDGSGPVWLGDVDCTGNEETLNNCSYSGWDEHFNCYHWEDAGVECSQTGNV
jgi:hypothetical protein